jgi:hypothetical protein
MNASRFACPRTSIRVVDDEIYPPINQSGSPMGLSRIYILVHGFNNDRYQAEESYKAIRTRLRKSVPSDQIDLIWDFYWPGFEDVVPETLVRHFRIVRWPNMFLTAALYSLQVSKAIQFGQKLGDYLIDLQGGEIATEIIFIGHSLGCRLILEAAREILIKTKMAAHNRIAAMCLMAAAVPTEHVETGGRLYIAAELPMHRIVLYSRNDHILKYAFPTGQELANDGHWPEAVGLKGNPRIRWTATDETMLGHSGYWDEPVTTPHILRLFGIQSPSELPGFPLLRFAAPEAMDLPGQPLPHDNVP